MLGRVCSGLCSSSLYFQVGVGIVIRLLWIAVCPFEPVSDSNIYHQFAQRIADGQGYVWADGSATAYWAVGTSAVYGLFYAIIGEPSSAVAVVNLISFILLCIAVRCMGKNWFGEEACSLSGWVVVFWPTLIMLSNIPNSELIYLPVFVGCILVLDPVSSKRKTVLNLFFGGLLAALAALVRPTAIILPGVLGCVSFLLHWGKWKKLVWYIMVSLVMVAAISPWTIRNYKAFDSFVPISLNFGPNFWMG